MLKLPESLAGSLAFVLGNHTSVYTTPTFSNPNISKSKHLSLPIPMILSDLLA
jgi:hypothetical protein